MLITALAVAGCSTSHESRRGAITGRAIPCPGPAASVLPGVRMTVTVSDSGGRVVARAAGIASPYRFHFVLPPGSYKVEGTGDAMVTAEVRGGAVTRTKLYPDCG